MVDLSLKDSFRLIWIDFQAQACVHVLYSCPSHIWLIGEGYGGRNGFFVATHYTCLHKSRCRLQSRENINIYIYIYTCKSCSHVREVAYNGIVNAIKHDKEEKQ